MIRVIHLLSSNSLSGAEKVAMSIINSCTKDVESFYASPSGNIIHDLEKYEIKHIPIDRVTPFSIYKIIRQHKPDIVHAHDFRVSIKLAFTPINCKKISHIHQNPPWMNRLNLYTIIYLVSCFFYNTIYSVSNQIFKDTLIAKYFHSKIINAPNHINENEIKELASKELYDNKYDLMFVGRLSEEKDPLRFIKIVEEIAREKKHIKAVIVGDGNLRNICLDYIKSHNLNDNIDVLGYLPNPYPVMSSSKILVVTSKWEGFGLAAVEALVLGKPVIAPPVGGLINIVNDKNGKLCSTDNDYHKHIISILSDVNVYNEASNYAKLSAELHTIEFDWFHEYKKLGRN